MTEVHLRRSRRYLDRAQSCAAAAAALEHLGIAPAFRAPYFMLIAHGTELALKAVLVDADDDQLITIGHDLCLCLRWARDRGLDVGPPDGVITSVVRTLALPHVAQALRYPSNLTWRLPHPKSATDALNAILRLATSALNEIDPRRG